MEGKWKITGEPIEKNGCKYMRIKKFQVSINPKKMSIDLDDLFNGNKLLGELLLLLLFVNDDDDDDNNNFLVFFFQVIR